MHLYEDLVALNKSERYLLSVESMSSVLNVQNKRKGIAARRGKGSFLCRRRKPPAIADQGLSLGRCLHRLQGDRGTAVAVVVGVAGGAHFLRGQLLR
jgi:hypothetical protein